MLCDFDLQPLVEPLLSWYEQSARALPWRENPSPYRVWVSEIMLQQTRVEAVKPYFTRFVEALPTVEDLAACKEDALLKLWEGLGYYNRVRNMQLAARQIVSDFDGVFPSTREALCTLKGIGPYTAGAIASIAFGALEPAVDGNVLRVLMRVCADEADIAKEAVKRDVEDRLRLVIPKEEASAFNQALMELGALVCLPNAAPLCGQCPWERLCEGHRLGTAERLPVKTKKKPRRVEKRTVLLLLDGENMALCKRPDKGLLAGLYELPNMTGHLTEEETIHALEKAGLQPLHIAPLPPAKHIFTHIEWHMIGYRVRVDTWPATRASSLFFMDPVRVRETCCLPSAFSSFMEYV